MNWEDAINALGGHREDTGGSCDAYRVPAGRNCYWLVTDTSAATVPDNGWSGLAVRYWHDRPDGVEALVTAETLAAVLALDWDSVTAARDAQH